MALKHAQLLDVIDLHATHEARGTSVSSSLLKTAHMQLMQLNLPQGHRLPAHHVPGEITIQCVAGEVNVVTSQCRRQLGAGQLMALPGGESHEIEASRDALLLVTVLRVGRG
ncbi:MULTISPECIES: cupin domain-containing protein [unclassified Variovorax]|uniref:cupin domain-containing protein n=1 Tax=unclassified Variovorax TaxID=663243 RepID=UPI001BD45064|nr:MULTISPECIES: cupin domain-containing protein [unclassified Variovorax]